MVAWPIDDIDIADLVSLTADQRRQETMQCVEIRQRQPEGARKRFQAAAAIAGAVAQDRASYHVGDARLQTLETGGLAADPLPGDQADARRASDERVEELWQKCRIIL